MTSAAPACSTPWMRRSPPDWSKRWPRVSPSPTPSCTKPSAGRCRGSGDAAFTVGSHWRSRPGWWRVTRAPYEGWRSTGATRGWGIRPGPPSTPDAPPTWRWRRRVTRRPPATASGPWRPSTTTRTAATGRTPCVAPCWCSSGPPGAPPATAGSPGRRFGRPCASASDAATLRCWRGRRWAWVVSGTHPRSSTRNCGRRSTRRWRWWATPSPPCGSS